MDAMAIDFSRFIMWAASGISQLLDLTEATYTRYKTDNQTGQFGNPRTVTNAEEYMKLKRVKDYSYHKEKMLLCKQAKKGVSLQVEQPDWLVDTDEEIDEQKLESHYSYMAKIQEVLSAKSRTDTEPLEQ
nr:hypothetical protein [Tanacetum cinerariifolium]